MSTTQTETAISLNDIVRRLGSGKRDAIYRVVGFTEIFGIPAAKLVRVRRRDLSSAILNAPGATDRESLSLLAKWEPRR